MCGYIIVLHSIDSIGFPGDIPHYCGIMGNFTVSGIFHEYCMRCTSLAMSVGRFPSINLFIIHGLAIILENEVYKLTGRKFSGVCGSVWTLIIITIPAFPIAGHMLLGQGRLLDYTEWGIWR
ncbi:hypothetical protein E3P86_04150 [Wallemia ichthyophaga]|uniref:Uncharacterized protein n=1 Tax=Wallemia ichthyophaga TaxID=245174 RepID=A0A4T0IB30_WALIC|nr:hypothetical protein E3P86_04150 [Wallemia ichthyophaga]